MDIQEKTLAEQFRSLQIAAHRYLRWQYRKAAEETHKEVTDKIFPAFPKKSKRPCAPALNVLSRH
ncbi:MAG: hypothetical protein LBK63_04240 [Treponema sp.]|jgi:hypothetical protein|nr:hypothetical protein [Treponema sp.]